MLFQAPKRKAKRLSSERRKPEPILQKGFGTEMPPKKQLVKIYFDQKGLTGQAELFHQCHEQANWSSPKGTNRHLTEYQHLCQNLFYE